MFFHQGEQTIYSVKYKFKNDLTKGFGIKNLIFDEVDNWQGKP